MKKNVSTRDLQRRFPTVDAAVVDDATESAAELAVRKASRNPAAFAKTVAIRKLAKHTKRERARAESLQRLPSRSGDPREHEDTMIALIDRARGKPSKKRRMRGPRKAGLTPDSQMKAIRAHAQNLFEISTGLRWTDEIATTFAGWIGPGTDYREWNRLGREAGRFLASLKRILEKHRECERVDPELAGFFERNIGLNDLRAYLEWRGPRLKWHTRKKVWSRDVRLYRYVYLHTFLNLGRQPTLDEMTSMSILLGHDVHPGNGQSATSYFEKHRCRMRNVIKMRPKVSGEIAEQRQRDRGVEPAEWPRTERATKTDRR